MKKFTPVLIGIIAVGAFFLTKKFTENTRKKMTEIYSTYKKAIDSASIMYGIPTKRIVSIIYVESSGRADAVGFSGEIGLMQLTPGVVKDFDTALAYAYTIEDMFTPIDNIQVGTWYLSMLWKKTKDLNHATQAYNAGLKNFLLNNKSGLSYSEKVQKYESDFV